MNNSTYWIEIDLEKSHGNWLDSATYSPIKIGEFATEDEAISVAKKINRDSVSSFVAGFINQNMSEDINMADGIFSPTVNVFIVDGEGDTVCIY